MYRISPAVAPPMLHTEDSEIRSGGVIGDVCMGMLHPIGVRSQSLTRVRFLRACAHVRVVKWLVNTCAKVQHWSLT